MKVVPTPIPGAFLIELEQRCDERGWFARSWCGEEFARHGLVANLVQANISYNERAGTLRGMHYQAEPHGETKLVRCTAGAIFDAIIDLRPGSPTFRRWHALELSAANHRAFYIPRGVAHGFQTLVEGSEVHYLMADAYSPTHSRGVRWDDPAFAILWPPAERRIIADKDLAFPDFAP